MARITEKGGIPTVFKIYENRSGHHVHMRIFSGEDKGHLAFCGTLVMRAEEANAFLTLLEKGRKESLLECEVVHEKGG